MQRSFKILVSALAFAGIGCNTDTTTGCCSLGTPGLRVVNAFGGPVDVLIDGQIAVSALAAGAIDTLLPAEGSHTIVLRATGQGTSTQSISSAMGALNTIAVLRASNGSVSSTVLDDTNSVVPTGKTKLRVLHFAPNAGTLQVYRTQPDYQTPISWQFPFNYQADPNSLSAPFFQSTVGTWEVRIWQTPTNSSGWDTAPVKVLVPLESGQKHTIIMLDKAGGGVRVEII